MEGEETIPDQSLHIEDLLYDIVEHSKNLVKGNGCSIYLREEGTTRYILRDSTEMSPYIGINSFSAVPDEKELIEKMGATKYAVTTKKIINVLDIRDFKYWSHYDKSEKDLKDTPIESCELPHHEVGPFLAIPLKDNEDVIGVLRVVKKRDENKNPFKKEDEEQLKTYIEKNIPKITGATDISHLLELGSMLDLKALCTRVVKVITKIVGGRGCSIYLSAEENKDIRTYRCVGTTGLHEVISNYGFKEIQDPYNEAYYKFKEDEVPQHLTTAVIKYKKNINEDLENFNSEDYFPEIKREGAKYWETYWKDGCLVPAGPSIFIPLFTPRRNKTGKSDVLGIIIINKIQGKPIFSSKEYRLCLSLSRRLSKVMLLSRFMDYLNRSIDISNDQKLNELFEPLIDQICIVSGAPGATLFIKSYDNKLESICFAGEFKDTIEENNKIIYELPHTDKDYGKKMCGYTVWVATFRKILRFNNSSELNQWQGVLPRPIHSGKEFCEVNSTPPSRFLAVPIIGMNDKLLGVLRTAKGPDDLPFSENDEMLFSSLATRLSPVIESLLVSSHLKEKQQSKLEKMFTKELMEKLSPFYENSDTNLIDKRIKEFFTIDPEKEIKMTDRIFDSISLLWDDSKIFTKEPPLSLFRFFDKQILAELPGYRDHFIHQYQVFLLGYYIIKKLNKFELDFSKSYCKSLAPHFSIKEEENPNPEQIANIAWVVASTFHDIAYPLFLINRWLPKTIEDFLGIQINPEVHFEQIFFKNQTYLKFVNELAEFFVESDFIPGIMEDDLRGWILSEVALNKDHGILSSLILLEPHFLRKKDIILPAALAIALHKKLGLKIKTHGGKIKYDKYPLAYLLLYCDLVQEWSRDPKNDKLESPTLENIIVTDNIEEIHGQSNIPEKVRDNTNTIYVQSEIIVADAEEKIKECNDWFGFLDISNPYFSIIVNNEFIPKYKNLKKLEL